MILLVAIVFGFLAGLIRAWAKKFPYRPPHIEHVWLVFMAYLPQFFAFYLPVTRTLFPDGWVPATLICSQLLLLIFVWLNRMQPGFWLLGIGLMLNLLVIALNGGMMPLSPENASKLIQPGVDVILQIGQRVGYGKDILLPIEQTRLWFLSDYFTLPQWMNYRLAFSIGDIVISTGAFWLFWSLGKSRNPSVEEKLC